MQANVETRTELKGKIIGGNEKLWAPTHLEVNGVRVEERQRDQHQRRAAD